jgi:hypothetical protein
MGTTKFRSLLAFAVLLAPVVGQNQGMVLGDGLGSYAGCAKPDCPEIELGAHCSLLNPYYGNGGQAGTVESLGDLILMLDRPVPLALRDLQGTAARYITCWPYSSRPGKNRTNASRGPRDEFVGPAPGPLLSPPKHTHSCTPPGTTNTDTECLQCQCAAVVVPQGSIANPPTYACECAVDVGGGSGGGGRGMSFPPGGTAENINADCTVVHKLMEGGGATFNSYYDQVGSTWTRRDYYDIRHPDGTVVEYSRVGLGNDSKIAATRITDPMDNVVFLSYDDYGRVKRIAYPNGIEEEWDYSPGWTFLSGQTGWPRYSGIEVRYTLPSSSQMQAGDLSWGMVFRNDISTNQDKHFTEARLWRIFYPKTEALHDISAGNILSQLHDLTTNVGVSNKNAVVEFEYDSATSSDARVTEVRNGRAADFTAGALFEFLERKPLLGGGD